MDRNLLGANSIYRRVSYSVRISRRGFRELPPVKGTNPQARILRKMAVKATNDMAKYLALTSHKSVIWMELVRYINGSPCCIISHYLPRGEFHFVLDEFEGGSLYPFLYRHYGIRLHRVNNLSVSDLPVGNEARLLKIPASQKIRRSVGINLDQRNGRAIEYNISRFRTDRNPTVVPL